MPLRASCRANLIPTAYPNPFKFHIPVRVVLISDTNTSVRPKKRGNISEKCGIKRIYMPRNLNPTVSRCHFVHGFLKMMLRKWRLRRFGSPWYLFPRDAFPRCLFLGWHISLLIPLIISQNLVICLILMSCDFGLWLMIVPWNSQEDKRRKVTPPRWTRRNQVGFFFGCEFFRRNCFSNPCSSNVRRQ